MINNDYEKLSYLGTEYVKLLIDNIKDEYNFESINNYNIIYFIAKDAEYKEYLKKRILNKEKKIQIFVFIYIGIIMCIFGILQLLSEKMHIHIFDMSFIFIYIGSTIILMGILLYFSVKYNIIKRKNRNINDVSNIDIVNLYEKINALLFQIVPDKYINNNYIKDNGMSSLGIFTKHEINFYNNLRLIRNNICHNKPVKLSLYKLSRIKAQSNDIIKKIIAYKKL